MIVEPSVVESLLNIRAGRMMNVGAINIDVRDILRDVIVRAAHCLPHESVSFVKNEIIGMLDAILAYYLLKAAGDVHKAAMSIMAESIATNKQAVAFDGKYVLLANMTAPECLELLIGLAASGRIEITVFESVFESHEFSWQSLADLYTAKNGGAK